MCRIKTIVAALACLLAVSNGLIAQVLLPSKEMAGNKISLNGSWKFRFIPSPTIGADSLFYEPGFQVNQWANINVPGNWELQSFADPVYHKRTKDVMGLYRTSFAVPASWKNTPVYLCFDGVEFGYTFWINGQLAGEFASAFNRQVFDVSKFVQPGDSYALAVKVITHPKGWEFDTNDDWALSGISRNVTLFTLPQLHIKDMRVKTFVNKPNARLDISAFIEQAGSRNFPTDVQLTASLKDTTGKLVKAINLQTVSDKQHYQTVIDLAQPRLWTAETPYLYTLTVTLSSAGKMLQQHTEKIGIREIAWANGILTLNGSPIKLRGATHHDLSPVNGRAITEAELLQDLQLMRKANMNFIRTSHYPPNERLLELCDSMGMYVDDEVPFGFGEEHLKDSSYLPILMQRAQATVFRDKNHASIIMWTVGNENPVTANTIKTAALVKQMDGTRPAAFPQGPTDFSEMMKELPAEVDLLAPHYLLAPDLASLAKTIDRPLVMTEYAHALGLDFNNMDSIYETMYANPKLAGGAVWEFIDQGILRKVTPKIATSESHFYVWKNADTVYHTSTNEGADGLMYANRVPQVDYWQARKVYTPVKASDNSFSYKAGNQSFQIQLQNRYDFTNLKAITCKWQLWADNSIISNGTTALSGKPHETVTVIINTNLPAKPAASVYYLKLLLVNAEGYQFYEKAYPIKQEDNALLLTKVLTGKPSSPVKTNNVISTANYKFELNGTAAEFSLKNKQGKLLIASAPLARVGRKTTLAEKATLSSRRPKVKHLFWNPYQLTPVSSEVKNFDQHQLLIHETYQPDSAAMGKLSGDVAYRFSDSGYIQVNYTFTPQGNDDATEAGLSFVVPASLSEFRWIGKGPYAAYPGKDKLSEFGIYHLNSNDLYFPGNRQQVVCAVFSDSLGNGFALLSNNANISVERSASGIIISHNAHVSQRYNKYEWPEDLLSFKNAAPIAGSFIIVPLSTAWPAALQALFGKPNQQAQAFQPFYKSYDE